MLLVCARIAGVIAWWEVLKFTRKKSMRDRQEQAQPVRASTFKLKGRGFRNRFPLHAVVPSSPADTQKPFLQAVHISVILSAGIMRRLSLSNNRPT